MTNKMSLGSFGALLSDEAIQRVPGLCFFYSNTIHGIPPIVGHYIKNVRSLHEIIVLTTIRYLPVKTVLPDERFLVKGLGYKGVYRCIAQYGYNDSLNTEGDEFMNQVTESLNVYIKFRACVEVDKSIDVSKLTSDDFMSSLPTVQENIRDLANAKESGIIHVLGKTRFQMRKSICWFDRILLGSIYEVLHRNCRSSMAVLEIPPSSSVEIGMIYEI